MEVIENVIVVVLVMMLVQLRWVEAKKAAAVEWRMTSNSGEEEDRSERWLRRWVGKERN